MVRKAVACAACARSCETLHQKQKDPSPIVARFVKVMIGGDHAEVLYLPPKFARKVVDLSGQETEIEDSTGAKWPVTYSIVNGALALQKGWNKFYREHFLELGDFVVFNYIKGSHFVVQIYSRRSACERTTFNAERNKRASKRPRWDPVTVPQEEPLHSTNLHSSRKKIDLQGQNRQTPMKNQDISFMFKRDEEGSQREDRGFLFDLSNFEIKKEKALEIVEVSPEKIAPCLVGDQMDVDINVLEKDLFSTDKETELDLIHADQNVDYLLVNVENGLDEEMEIAPCNAEITADATHINNDSDDIFTDKFQTKLSDESDVCKNVIDNVISSLQNGKNNVVRPNDETTSIGNIKIAETESAVKPGFASLIASSAQKDPFVEISEKESAVKPGYASAIASSAPKDPFVNCSIKKDLAEAMEEAQRFLGKSRDAAKETSSHAVVKVEPDLLYEYDAVPSDAMCSFSAEVKSLKFLELPVHIPDNGWRRSRGRGKFVRLRDPTGRLWAILNPIIYSVKALTGYWTEFCQQNGIKPGDECRFHVENNKLCIYRVDIVRK